MLFLIRNKQCNSRGVYQILCTATGKVYIGSTELMMPRWHHHKRGLRLGIHANRNLQEAFARYGEDTFTFSIIETVPTGKDLREREQFYLDRRFGTGCYNIHPCARSSKGARRLA